MKSSEKTIDAGNYKIKFIHAITKLVFATSVGVSLLFFSVNYVTANDTKKFNFPDELTEADKRAVQNSNGRYQMQLSSLIDETGATWWYILVWDTQTARSKYYYGSIKEGTQAALGKFQLPSSPL